MDATAGDAARLLDLWSLSMSDAPGTRWPRSTDVLGTKFVAARGLRLAKYCHAGGVTDPLDLPRKDVAEAIGYASEQSMRNAMNVKGVRTEHFKAEAYRLLRGNLL